MKSIFKEKIIKDLGERKIVFFIINLNEFARRERKSRCNGHCETRRQKDKRGRERLCFETICGYQRRGGRKMMRITTFFIIISKRQRDVCGADGGEEENQHDQLGRAYRFQHWQKK